MQLRDMQQERSSSLSQLLGLAQWLWSVKRMGKTCLIMFFRSCQNIQVMKGCREETWYVTQFDNIVAD